MTEHSCGENCKHEEHSNQFTEYIQQELQVLTEQIQYVETNLVQLNSITLALNALKNSKENEILLPIANGIYIKTNCKDKNNNKILVNVGANVVLEKEIEDAKNILAEKSKELENNHKELINQYTETVNIINNLQERSH